ncbi:exodeoxyribonuclease V subunit alpha [Desulfatirhabdium butyrativorans]|uniref:exodeoxyribonuclease V subunit alpha n=1 Tax=Desulfatirhabdium butyrativorans TaxID=340467 RepID=UPI000410D55C|nr:exodeoxyribonuclease V subunit alpha [Desulfatirhabdium butyrativorans]
MALIHSSGISLLERLRSSGFFSHFDYHLARSLGRIAPEADPLVLLAAAVASRFTLQGHTCVDLGKLACRPIESSEGMAFTEAWPEASEWVSALIQSPLVWREPQNLQAYVPPEAPLVLDPNGRLYLARLWACQRKLADRLNACIHRPSPDIAPDLLDAGLDRLFGHPDDPVREAARRGVIHSFCVISGGPGTGKTTTVLKILALLVEQRLNGQGAAPAITILAPTGKAAARLREVLQQRDRLPCADAVRAALPADAQTIHRGLGARSDQAADFRYHARNPLPADIVVVDEASMIDLSLMHRLLEAIAPETRLILLGDSNQLASVEAGSVLADVCSAARMNPAWGERVIRLTKNYRFSETSGIGRLARAVANGADDEAMACLKDPSESGIRHIDLREISGIWEMARVWMEKWLRLEDGFEREREFSRFRILCAHRQGTFGVEAANAVLDRMARGILHVPDNREWYAGRPVMVLRNDYGLGLSNGDIGWMCFDEASMDRYRHGTIRFPLANGQERGISPYRLPPHETAYSMTIHKSQGSEFDEVVVLLPDRPSPILTRELLYTAITRACKSVAIVGEESLIRHAIRTPVERHSGLVECLAGAVQ